MLLGSTAVLKDICRSWSACWRGVKYQLPTSIDGCPWKADWTHTSIFPSSTACRWNISSIVCIDWTASLNLGDERPVSIMDCLKYCRLLGCLLWYEYVLYYNRMSIHTLWMVFLSVAVLGCTQFLGCGEQPLQFQSLLILDLLASSFDYLLFPWVYIVFLCYRPFCTILVSVV